MQDCQCCHNHRFVGKNNKIPTTPILVPFILICSVGESPIHPSEYQ